ncbi:endonuclease domain-containing protein [Maribacter sp. 2308TA10-17]|uniref:endonuclease domain-containing protein n=1 Tax=Maribacter sp. 2308TA10-17 TaxID=3386276 RepID=UPI0039BCB6AF
MKKDLLKINGMHDGATPSIFNNAAKLRLKMTATEEILWEELKNKPLGFKFRRQHPINFFILDFYCHQKRLSIEIDGEYHASIEQQEKDQLKTEYLNSVGIKEIRFKNKKVLDDLEFVLAKIHKELNAASH